MIDKRLPPKVKAELTALRDYFAAAALTGLVSAEHGEDARPAGFPKDRDPKIGDWQKHFAEVAYGYADALITQRSK